MTATHYDTLKIARNAPPEVIYEAYKALAQKYHPDKNLHDPGAIHMMQSVNAAYKILSDPKKRLEHDQWIRQQEPAAQAQTAQERTTQAKVDKAAADAATWTALAAKAAQEVKAARERAADAAAKAASGGSKWADWAAQAAKAVEEEEKKAAKVAAKAAEEEAKLAAAAPAHNAAPGSVTYYDTLKITRDAPFEVVRAAYKAFAQKYNADNAASAEVARLMQAVTTAYKILADEQKRAEYDQALRAQDPKLNAQSKREPTRREKEAQAAADKAASLATAAIAWAEKAAKDAMEAEEKYNAAMDKARAAKAANAKDVAAWTAWETKMATEAKEARARATKAAAAARDEKWKAERADAENKKIIKEAEEEAAKGK
jgi:DnaJ-class molecular chaperone